MNTLNMLAGISVELPPSDSFRPDRRSMTTSWTSSVRVAKTAVSARASVSEGGGTVVTSVEVVLVVMRFSRSWGVVNRDTDAGTSTRTIEVVTAVEKYFTPR
jgi:hypothetical protein